MIDRIQNIYFLQLSGVPIPVHQHLHCLLLLREEKIQFIGQKEGEFITVLYPN